MRHVTAEERRSRIAVRHRLCPSASADSAESVTSALVALHATEPAAVYLSCWARAESLQPTDIDRALYTDRSIVKQLAMRRTLFAFPRDLLPAVWSSAAARVADIEKARIVKGVEAAGLSTDGRDWLERAHSEVRAELSSRPNGRTALEIRQAVPRINVPISLAAGSRWASTAVLTQMGAAAEITRGANLNHWRASRPLWTLTKHWLPEATAVCPSTDGYRELVRRWLHSFGPGTLDDLVWWLGTTKTVARQAISDLDAVPVSLEGGQTGWLLPDDLEKVDDPGPWAALLPTLDPTVMGWKLRDFYLDPHEKEVFDRRGNARTTAWVNGRVVGSWDQDRDGHVRVLLLEAVSKPARRALDEQAASLTAWLAGVRVRVGFTGPAPAAQ